MGPGPRSFPGPSHGNDLARGMGYNVRILQKQHLTPILGQDFVKPKWRFLFPSFSRPGSWGLHQGAGGVVSQMRHKPEAEVILRWPLAEATLRVPP